MRIGVALGHSGESVTETVENAKRAEDLGFDIVGVADSQSSQRELYTVLSLITVATRRIVFGPLVTNPVTRSPHVTACALASLAEVSPGRVFLGFGRGNSAVRGAGVMPATTQEYRNSIATIRRVPQWSTAYVPVIVHAAGPKGTDVATEMGDGVLLRWGDKPAAAARSQIMALHSVAAATARLGRALEIWMYVNVFVGDLDYGREVLGRGMAGRARWIAPEEFPEELRDAQRRYQTEFENPWESPTAGSANYQLLRDLGLDGHMFSRFAVIGDLNTLRECLASMEMMGVDVAVLGVADPKRNAVLTSAVQSARPTT